jgi:hypothetical protein
VKVEATRLLRELGYDLSASRREGCAQPRSAKPKRRFFSKLEITMPKFVIERDMPKIGTMSDADAQAGAQKSCDVLRAMGPEIQWVESYVTADKIFCVYLAPNEAMIREHAEKSGFPATHIRKVERMLDPITSEGKQAA